MCGCIPIALTRLSRIRLIQLIPFCYEHFPNGNY